VISWCDCSVLLACTGCWYTSSQCHVDGDKCDDWQRHGWSMLWASLWSFWSTVCEASSQFAVDLVSSWWYCHGNLHLYAISKWKSICALFCNSHAFLHSLIIVSRAHCVSSSLRAYSALEVSSSPSSSSSSSSSSSFKSTHKWSKNINRQ